MFLSFKDLEKLLSLFLEFHPDYQMELTEGKVTFAVPSDHPLEEVNAKLLDLCKLLNITWFIAQLPSAEVKQLAYTPDLEKEWVSQRRLNSMKARCFFCVCLNLDPIYWLGNKERKALTKQRCEFLRQFAHVELRFWKLIQAGFKYLPQNEFHYKAEEKLFGAIIQEIRDNRFLAFTNDYYEILVDDWQERLELSLKNTLTPSEEKKVFKDDEIYPTKLMDAVGVVFIQEAKHDDLLRECLEAFCKEWKALTQLRLEMSKARTGEGGNKRVFHSEVWRHGKRRILKQNKPI